MSNKNYLAPNEIASYTIDTGIKKVSKKYCVQFLLGILAGVFIAFAAEGSNVSAYGLGKAMAVLEKKVKLKYMLINWTLVYLDNFVGSLLIAFMIVKSGQLHMGANMYYIAAGILAKSNPHYAHASHLPEEALNALNWKSFIVNNLVPVTLGNIIGGAVFVGAAYWFIYVRKNSQTQKSSI